MTPASPPSVNPALRLNTPWCGMLRKEANARTPQKCRMVGVTKARRPVGLTALASRISAMTTNVRPVRPPAEEPTMT
jgi:hypothetical protein